MFVFAFALRAVRAGGRRDARSVLSRRVFVATAAPPSAPRPASRGEKRRFKLEFLKIRSCFSLVRKFFTVFVEPISFDTLLRRNS